VEDIGLNGNLAAKWSFYTHILSHNAVYLHDEEDELVWTWKKSSGILPTKQGYESLSINLVVGDKK
jgi:hypothetical protein